MWFSLPLPQFQYRIEALVDGNLRWHKTANVTYVVSGPNWNNALLLQRCLRSAPSTRVTIRGELPSQIFRLVNRTQQLQLFNNLITCQFLHSCVYLHTVYITKLTAAPTMTVRVKDVLLVIQYSLTSDEGTTAYIGNVLSLAQSK